MIRRIASVAVVVLAGSLLSAAPAAAFDPPTIEVDAGTAGRVQVDLTGIDNGVSSVKLQLGALPEQLVLVSNHAASATFDTWGLDGSVPLTVIQCLQPEATTCDPALDPAPQVVVDNPEPSYTPDREGTLRTHDFAMTVGLEHGTGDPRLRVGVDDGETTLVEPGAAIQVDVDPLAEGQHAVHAAVCSTDGLICTEPTSGTFQVVRTVNAGFERDEPTISPNGDGVLDTVTFTWSLVGPWDDGVIEIRDAGQAVVRAIPVTAPTPPETEASLVYDGTDELSATLPSGSYTATLVARRLVDGEVLSNSYVRDFSVDVDVVPPTDLAVTNRKVYPATDKYLDTTKVTWTDVEEYTRVDLRVTDSLGKQVRLWRDVTSGVVWDGRKGDGKQLPNGTYELRVRSFDAFGNRAWSEPVTVQVSDKVLVTRTRSVTLTPKASRNPERGFIGDCSRVRFPSVHGWAGSASYLSNALCDEGYEASVVSTVHQAQLPAAVKYRKVQLAWYGGPTKATRSDRGRATLYKSDRVTFYWPDWIYSLRYLTAQHLPWVPAAEVLDGRWVTWAFATDSGNRYDVKSFTIRYKADVLVKPS